MPEAIIVEHVGLGAGAVARGVGVRLDRRVALTAAQQPVGQERGLHAELARGHDDEQRRGLHLGLTLVGLCLLARPLHALPAAERRREKV